MTIQSLAKEAYSHLTTSTRHDDTRFITIADTAPEWVSSLCYVAHGGGGENWRLPDDHTFSLVRSALEHIADDGGEDGAHEWADGEVDVYTSEKFEWLASNMHNQSYVDEARLEFDNGNDGEIADAVGAGQFLQACEVWHSVYGFLDNMAEELGEEEEDG